MIEAAGGVIWRTARKGDLEVVVIHRPRQDDWSLPKGKVRRRESALDCALREVLEETGLECSVGHELPTTFCEDRRGRAKRVRYWAMQALAGEFRPNREVDKLRWVRLDRVADVLTHAHDVVVVAGLQQVVYAAVA